jgi:hypothetical protein
MKSVYIAILCLIFMACSTPISTKPDSCPPLPELPDNATRAQGRLHWLTIIALYEQCAKGQQ